jgi:glycosyltransferase involved in cell wall biosynthesis
VKICITSGTYHPDIGGPPTYLFALANDLIQRGHQLKVVTYGCSAHGYPYQVIRIPRELPAPPRLTLFGMATLRAARTADLLYVNDYGLPPAVANLLLHKPLVMKIVGDFAWEYSVRHKLVPPSLSLDEFQEQRFEPSVERLRALQKWYSRRADVVITPSRYLAGVVEGWGVPRERLRVIYNAATPEYDSAPACDFRDRLGLPVHKTFAVATVARLAPWKGVDVLIRALAEARPERPELRLLVVGDGDERPRLEQLAEPLGDAVRFAGQVSRQTALAMIREVDAVALCSAYEGLSHVLLEAMQAGRPIVATSVGGNTELIGDGENGILVPYGDVGALARALVLLATDDNLALRLGQQARQDARARSWPTLVNHTLGVFQEALARRGASLA